MEVDHKELVLGLIGSTYGEIKRLDDSIIGSSSTLTRRSDAVKQELTNLVKGMAQKPDVKILQMMQPPQGVPTNPQISPEMPPVNITAPQPPLGSVLLPYVEPVLKPETNQLMFDLDRIAKYDDVITEIDRLDRKLNRLEDKIDQIIESIGAPKKKARGLNSF